MGLIVGPDSETALSSLYYGDLERDSFSESWVFRDLPACREYVEGELEKA
jgi:hypothetical protein